MNKAVNQSSVLLLLGACYSLQSSLGAATFQGMPAILRSVGVEHQQIGLIYLLMLPWVLKFLWAAPFERWRRNSPNRTRQVILAGNLLAIATLLVLLPLQPSDDFWWLFLGLAVIALLSSTVDVALDGFALAQRKLAGSWINTMQIGGGYAGTIIGGGLLLLAIDAFGWQSALVGLCVVLCLLLSPSIISRQQARQRYLAALPA